MATKVTRRNPFEDFTKPVNNDHAYPQNNNQEGFNGEEYGGEPQMQNDWGQPAQEYSGRMTNPFGKPNVYAEEPQYNNGADGIQEDGYTQASNGGQAWNPDADKPQQLGQYDPGNSDYSEKAGFGYGAGSGTNKIIDPLNEPPLLEGKIIDIFPFLKILA